MKIPWEFSFCMFEAFLELYPFSSEIPEMFGNFSLWPLLSARNLRLRKHATKRHVNLSSDVYLSLTGMPGILKKAKYCCHFVLPVVVMLHQYGKSLSGTDIPFSYIRLWFRVLNHMKEESHRQYGSACAWNIAAYFPFIAISSA